MHVVVDGRRTYVERLGSGPALALVHGGLGSDHQGLRPWLDPLADDFTLVYVDLLGNGRSDDPDDWAAVDLSTWSAQLSGLRSALDLDRWTLLGHSFGGIVAQAYALEHPDELNGLILCTTGSKVDRFDERWEIAARHTTPEQLELMQSGLLREMASDEEFERVWKSVVSAYFVDKSWVGRMRPRSRYSSAAFNRAVELLPEVDFTDRLPSLTVPTLVVGASEDWSFPPASGPLETHALLPASEYVELTRSGHFPFVEEQDAFLAAVGGWLRRTVLGETTR